MVKKTFSKNVIWCNYEVKNNIIFHPYTLKIECTITVVISQGKKVLNYDLLIIIYYDFVTPYFQPELAALS